MLFLVRPFPARGRRVVRSVAILGLTGLMLAFAGKVWLVIQPPSQPTLQPEIVSDVGQLTRTAVGAVVLPTTVEEVVAAVRNSRGPISIGGARHSTGGQIAAAAVFIWICGASTASSISHPRSAESPCRPGQPGAVWTRGLIDAALDTGGSYYVPYQLDATPAQFRRAYSRAPEYIALKRRLDPDAKFRNALIDKYLQ